MIPAPLLALASNKWVLVAVAVLGAYAVGQIHGRGAIYEEWIEANVEAAKQANKTILKQQVVTERVVEKFRDRIVKVKGETQVIIKEVDRYVPPTADVRLPFGWRLLHDAATTGAVPPPTKGLDVTAPDVGAAFALTRVVGNYGTCRATAEKLIALQSWVREQYETTNGEKLEGD